MAWARQMTLRQRFRPRRLTPATRWRAWSLTAAGAALIAEQGQPPKPYRVGAKLPGGWTLQAVLRRSAVLDAGDGRQMRLQMPEPAPPARRAP